ncbi:MAG: universal stress protein [Sandaracinus sp.]|nr:universal stress protein [Sandaracinus sp.]MCB9633518.1 universal stress protein [Sandaracinus sp.]
MPTILVATDLERSGDEALELAAAWARREGARVHAVHVVGEDPVPPDADPGIAPAIDALAERLHARWEHARRTLDEHAVHVAGQVETRTSLAVGRPWEAIVDAAKELGPSLVVVGPHVRHGGALARLRDRLLGSTARRVVRHAGAPVLVASGDVEPLEKALGLPAMDVLVAVDLAEGGRVALEAARAIGGPESRYVLVHVLQDPFAPADAPLDWARVREEWERTVLARLREEGVALGSRVEVEVRPGSPATALAEAAQAHGVQLVVAGAHAGGPLSRVLLGSTAERLLQTSPVPVLVVPPKRHSEPPSPPNDPREETVP